MTKAKPRPPAAPAVAEIEAAIWRAGARERADVEQIMRMICAYAAAADCPPDPNMRRMILARAIVDQGAGR